MLKQEFVKEFAPGADTLLKHLESEPRFAAYLLLDAHGKKHTRRIVRMSNQQTTQPPVVASGGVEALQHRAVQRFLFLAIYLNRCELSAAEGSVSSATACLNALFNALELCAQAVNLPTHLSMSDAFLATFVFADACHTQSNASSNNNTTTTLELYDFGVLSASRLLVRLAALASLSACKKTGDSKASTTSIVAFLAANLLMTRSGLGYAVRLMFSIASLRCASFFFSFFVSFRCCGCVAIALPIHVFMFLFEEMKGKERKERECMVYL